MHEYFAEVKNYGFPLVEVSNNRLEISPQEKVEIIQTAIDRYGLKVLAETGSKVEATSVEELIMDIQRNLNGGHGKYSSRLTNSSMMENSRIRLLTKSVR